MLRIFLTDKFIKSYKRLPKYIQDKTDKKTRFFKNNPKHPSLNLEKLEPLKLNLWSLRVNKVYRIIFTYSSATTAEFLLVDRHDNIYKKIKKLK